MNVPLLLDAGSVARPSRTKDRDGGDPPAARGDDAGQGPSRSFPEDANRTFGKQCWTRPVNVCFLIDRLCRAGTETQLVALINSLDRRRVRPLLCLLDGLDELSRSLEPGDCETLRLGVRSLWRPSTVRAALKFARFLRQRRVDILQMYFPDSTYFGTVVGRAAQVPYLVRTRNNLGWWLTPSRRRIERLLNRLVSMTVANSRACRLALLKDAAPPPRSVVVVENGVDLDRFAAIAPWQASGKPRRVGMVANLRPVKGPDLFLEVAARIAAQNADVEFLVAGEGEMRGALEAETRRLGLVGRFRLLGRVDDIPSFLAGLDVAVLSSRSEGMSNAVLEYMAAGRPMVVTAVGANTDLVDHGVTGLVVSPGDASELTRALQHLLSHPVAAQRMALAAQDACRTRYHRQINVQSFERIFLELAAGRRPG